VLNGANEVAVEAFLQRRIGLLDIPAVIRRALDDHHPTNDLDLEDLLDVDRQARRVAEAVISGPTR
jgi:1-deoxy-D-xylulose-5-phosphate reductoisomerase